LKGEKDGDKMKTKEIMKIMAMLFLTGIIAIMQVKASDWPTFHHDGSRTGSTTSPAPNNPVLLWQRELPNAIVSSPAVANGKIFIGCDDQKIYALDANIGEKLWNYTTDGLVRSSPTVARLNGESFDRVFISTDNPSIYCFNASNGKFLWRHYLYGGNTETRYAVRSSPLVDSGYVYIVDKYDVGVGTPPHSRCVIEKFNAYTGQHILNRIYGREDTLPQYSSAAIYAGRIYAGFDTKVRCHDSSDLTVKWSFSAGGHVYSTPAYYNGRVYFGSADGKTYAVDVLLGTQLWNYTTGSIFGSPAVSHDMVFVVSDGAPYCVYALNSTTGALIWYNNMTYPLKSSPAVADGKVFVGTLDGKLIALNSSTGQEVWSYPTGTSEEIWSSPAIADGVIYFGSNDHYLYAIKDSIVVSDPSRDPEGDVNPWTDIDVFVNVTASQGIRDVIISYTTNRTASWENITMTLYNAETGTYNGTIPGQQPDTLITYKIIAYDRFGDFVVKDGESLRYIIIVIPEFSILIAAALLIIIPLIAILQSKRRAPNLVIRI